MAAVIVTNIRPMHLRDVPAVLALERETFSQPWDEQIIRSELGADNRVYAVAESDDGSIGGYGGLLMNGCCTAWRRASS